ncbi:hypothetical protein QRO08_03835 [Paracidovorax citrulli]|uniref:Uncharacterized protein n=2 Tax=Paracidovorax citrulli TaxID=80869 RepID=A1TR61_PARC0|nr:hypothetical protein [Paracidovorax citrulli]ABM33449.1 hypothetical protein Aave_2881 [Paracidovorax citrulli AAC00-1]MVT28109.1 hypothetical protein [Paracidovorax citrulli]MVT28825.1 hypothetical protein [Paracidovorax citrulli]MVT37319.1 hypothetical protein [Paracidovorax citrulli]MVT37340.1 hypothetical protein [Paracidovorax citrulli]
MYELTDNGDLAWVLGEEVADAILSLPPAEPDQPETVTVDTHAQQLGPIRLTLARHRYKRGKRVFWIWVASRADRLPLGTPPKTQR